MVQHPLIKKRTAVSVQPASQSAGYEEEQGSPPPTLGPPGLSCISYCNCSTLGSAQTGDKAVGVKLGVAKEGKVWGKDSGGGPVQLRKPNRDARRPPPLPTRTFPSLSPPLFPFLSSAEVISQVGLLSFSSRNKSPINPLALTDAEVSVAHGRQPSLVVVQEMFGFRHHAVAPQEEVGEYCVDHPESAHTYRVVKVGGAAPLRSEDIFKGR